MERIVELLKATCMVSRILKHHVCISTCMYYALNTQRKLGQLINISEFFMRSKLMRSPLRDICNQKFHAFFLFHFTEKKLWSATTCTWAKRTFINDVRFQGTQVDSKCLPKIGGHKVKIIGHGTYQVGRSKIIENHRTSLMDVPQCIAMF